MPRFITETTSEDFISINEKLRTELVRDIVDGITMKLFGYNRKTGNQDIRKTKIEGNINLVSLGILGKKIHKNAIASFKETSINKYLQTICRKGEAVGIIAAQSLIQPITQAVLKSQHSAGKEQKDSGSSILIDLCRLRVSRKTVNVHFKDGIQKDEKEMMEQFGHVNFDEVIVPIFGKSKYEPLLIDESYYKNTSFVYIRIKEKNTKKAIYRFTMDPNKLKDANIIPNDVFAVLYSIEEIGFVVHPLYTFTFDIHINNLSLSVFLELLKASFLTKLKGIEGLTNITSHSIEAIDFSKPYYDEKENKTYFYLKNSMIHLFPVSELKKRIYKRTSANIEPVSDNDLISDNTKINEDDDNLYRLVYDGFCLLQDEFVEKIECNEEKNLFVVKPSSSFLKAYPYGKLIDYIKGGIFKEFDARNQSIIYEGKPKFFEDSDLFNSILKHDVKSNKFIITPTNEFNLYFNAILLLSKNKNTHVYFKNNIIAFENFIETAPNRGRKVFYKSRNGEYFEDRKPETVEKELYYVVLSDEINLDELKDYITYGKFVRKSETSLIYEGEPTFKTFPYVYYKFFGTMTSKSIITNENLLNIIDKRYFISNDPLEMIPMVGTFGARANHEYNFSVELTKSGNPVAYPHISLICGNIFQYKLNPITPVGFLSAPGNNPLDKLNFQGFKENLSDEIVKASISSTKHLTSAILTGRAPKMGTNYIEISINEEARKKVIDLISDARTEQKYSNKYNGIDFHGIGVLRKKGTPLSKIIITFPISDVGL